MVDANTDRLGVTIRDARRDDLRPLEWFGTMSAYREVIERAFARAEAGEIAFLVAEADGFPIGQVWADLTTGVIWAQRVIPHLQSRGVGTRLMAAAENRLRAAGIRTAELAVGRGNPAALRLYERLGYRHVRDEVDRWQFTTPDGRRETVEEQVCVMRKALGSQASA